MSEHDVMREAIRPATERAGEDNAFLRRTLARRKAERDACHSPTQEHPMAETNEMVLRWISEGTSLPRVGQRVLVATPRQAGEFWDVATAMLLIRFDGVMPLPVKAGSAWPTEYWWGYGYHGSETGMITGNGYWAALDEIPLPPGAEHSFRNGYHVVAQTGEVFVPQER